MPLSKKDMTSLRRSPLRCQLRSRNYFTVFAWYTAIRYFIFISYRKPCAIAADTDFFRASGGGLVVFPPPEGHITRRSIFTFLGLRARTLHLGAERYSDSCCLYGVGMWSQVILLFLQQERGVVVRFKEATATNQPTCSAFCCCFLLLLYPIYGVTEPASDCRLAASTSASAQRLLPKEKLASGGRVGQSRGMATSAQGGGPSRSI